MNSQLKDLELAAQKREYGTIWQLVNQIAGQNKKPVIVRKLDGSLPKDKAEILDEWSTYFSTLLNNKNIYADPANRPLPTPDNNSLPTTRITRGEITAAINSLKRSKSPGLDYAMTAEVLRDGGKFLGDQLHKICQLVFDECHAPKQWTSSIIVPLPKKGNLQLMTNYRGISTANKYTAEDHRRRLSRRHSSLHHLHRLQKGIRLNRPRNDVCHSPTLWYSR
jgi:hypothetical protein